MDLILEGDLFRDSSTTVVKLGKRWVTGVKRPINSDKIDGMTKLYGVDKFRVRCKVLRQASTSVGKPAHIRCGVYACLSFYQHRGFSFKIGRGKRMA